MTGEERTIRICKRRGGWVLVNYRKSLTGNIYQRDFVTMEMHGHQRVMYFRKEYVISDMFTCRMSTSTGIDYESNLSYHHE
jgi:hypothetical protein